MAEKNEEAAAVEIDLDSKTFDLGAWVKGNHRYPSYTATVHMDKEAVARSNEALSEIKKIDKRLPGLREAAEKSGGSDSLVETSGPRAAYSKAVEQRRAHVKTYNAFRAEAKDSELKLVFRSKGEDAQKRVRTKMEELIPGFTKMGEQEIQEKLGNDEELATQQQSMLFLELIEDITNAQGQRVDHAKMGADAVRSLFRHVASRDSMRIATAMNLAMMASELVEEEVDAGFLG